MRGRCELVRLRSRRRLASDDCQAEQPAADEGARTAFIMQFFQSVFLSLWVCARFWPSRFSAGRP